MSEEVKQTRLRGGLGKMWEIELTEEQIKNLREAGKSGKIKVATEKGRRF